MLVAERFHTLPSVVLQTCAWEHIYATLRVTRELDEYREYVADKKSKEDKKDGSGVAHMTLDAKSFVNMFGDHG